MKKISRKPKQQATSIQPKSDVEIIKIALSILSKDTQEVPHGALMTAIVRCGVPIYERTKKCKELLPLLNKTYEQKQTRVR